MIKLLFVEDDPACAYSIQGGLELEGGYDIRLATNGKEALEIFGSFCPDVVVSDVEMPEMGGCELAQAIRAKNSEVVIMLASGLTSPKALDEGYKIDIDEYVKKPYIARELHLRIQAVLKRVRKTTPSSETTDSVNSAQMPLGDYVFDTENNTLSYNYQSTQKLTPLEADILQLLLKNKNSLVSRSDLLQHFWPDEDPEFSSRSLDVFISKLRKYLSRDPFVKIENVRGKGLRLTIG